MTGRSLVGILTSDRAGQVDPARTYTLTGKERHCPAQEAPNMGGYPCRALRDGQYLYIRNFTPDRWPAGTPHWRQAAFPGSWLGDCDNGPTKTYMVDNKDQDAEHQRFYGLAFGKRGAEELYDLKKDPDQLDNVVADPAFAAVRTQLATRLTQLLAETGDPRVVGGGEQFDEYPYLGGAPLSPEFEQAKKKSESDRE
jgi:N-sulfoglucosamine sulfohydrolase